MKMDNFVNATKSLLHLLKVKKKKHLEDSILSHPKYSSLLSVSDTLEKYNITTLAVKIDADKLKDMPIPCNVQVKKMRNSLFFVSKAVKINLSIFFLLFHFLLSGQVINGTVIDAETKELLENVNIYYKRLEIGTTSDHKGNFSLIINTKTNTTDSLYLSYVGYENKVVPISSFSENNVTISIFKKTENLKEVVVKGIFKNVRLKKSLEFKTIGTMPEAVFAFGSTLVGDTLFIVGGNASVLDNPSKRALDKSNMVMNPTFEDFAKNLTIDISKNLFSNKVQIFDLNNNTWIANTIKLENRAYHTINYFDGHLYVMGGKHLSSNRRLLYMEPNIDIINIVSNIAISDRTNPHQAANFASFIYDDNIIVMGGSKIVENGKVSFSDEVHTYDITTGYWYTLPSMTKAKEVKGILVKDKIFLIGGFNGKELSEIESFDLQTGVWKQEWELAYGISNPGLAYHNDIIYIYDYGRVITYDLITKFMRQFEIPLHLKDASLHYFNNSLYLVGGNIEREYTKTPSSKIYKIDIKQFSQVESSLIKNLKK